MSDAPAMADDELPLAEAAPEEQPAEPDTDLYPRCAREPDKLARVACDVCGVFFCGDCISWVERRGLCRDCRSRRFEFQRDLITEGHIQAIANFNFLIALGGALAIWILREDPRISGGALGPLIMLSALFFAVVLPVWLALNLRRYWPVGRAFQMFLSLGVLLGGGLLTFYGSGDWRIQGFLLADYNFAILYVLISSAGSSCFRPRYRDVIADSPRVSPKLSSLYVLFFFWVVLTFVMLKNTVFKFA